MLARILSGFFRQKLAVARLEPKEWLKARIDASGVGERFLSEDREKTQRTAKVFYNAHYLSQIEKEAPFSLDRSLTKIPAVNVDGDKAGFFQDGTPFPSEDNFFSRILSGDKALLSPDERLSGAKKIIFSESSVFARGGYPAKNEREILDRPRNMGIFSLPGASFENTYLHYGLFILDPFNNRLENKQFEHLYQNTHTKYKEAQRLLGEYDGSSSMMYIRTGLPLLARSLEGQFYTSFSKRNAVVFLSEAYSRFQLEDVSMLLTAVNEMAKQAEKPAFLKATAVGMGFFAKVNREYDIQSVLFPYYLQAFNKLLTEQSYPWIKKIEFPFLSEIQRENFSHTFDTKTLSVDVTQSQRDVLAFTEEEMTEYYPCIVNPTDAFSYSGNEWGLSSVESMIGMNSSLRIDQVPIANPCLLENNHQIAVIINPHDFSATLKEPSETNHLQIR